MINRKKSPEGKILKKGCPQCGAPVSTDDYTCFVCGKILREKEPVAYKSSVAAALPDFDEEAGGDLPDSGQEGYWQEWNQPPQARYKRVGGWLLLLCVILTILYPLAILLTSYAVITSKFFDRSSGRVALDLIQMVLRLGLAGYGVYAGSALWTRRTNAILTVKTFLAVLLSYNAVVALITLLLGAYYLQNSIDPVPYIISAFGGIVVSIIYVSAWWAYLDRSQRMADLFGP